MVLWGNTGSAPFPCYSLAHSSPRCCSFLAITLLYAFKVTASWALFRACCLPPTTATVNPIEVCSLEKSAFEQEVSILIGQTSTRLLPVSQENYYLCQRWSKEGRGWEITREGNLGDSFAESMCMRIVEEKQRGKCYWIEIEEDDLKKDDETFQNLKEQEHFILSVGAEG